MKRLFNIVLLLSLSILLTVPVSAANFKVVKSYSYLPVNERTVNGAVFSWNNSVSGSSLYATKNGKTFSLTSSTASGELLSNGSVAYFFEKGTNQKKLVFYKTNLTTGKKTKIVSFKTSYPYVTNLILVGKNLYFTHGEVEGDFSRINLSIKKYRKIKEYVTFFTKHGQYFLLSDGTGAGYSYLGSYDTKSGKYKKIISKPIQWFEKNNKVYIVVVKSGNNYSGNPYTIKIVRYNLKTGKSKTIVNSLTVKRIIELTNTYIKYINSNGTEKTLKF